MIHKAKYFFERIGKMDKSLVRLIKDKKRKLHIKYRYRSNLAVVSELDVQLCTNVKFHMK